MLLKTLLVIVVIIGTLFLYGALKKPKNVLISRSLVIPAKAEKIFPYVNNPRLVQDWNPFTEGDPTVKMIYEGPTEGVGAKSSWEGKSGVGTATILKSEANKRVEVQLDFKKPFHVTNFGEYQLEATGAETKVTWIINETASIPRFLSVFVNLDKLVGSQFEKGLAKLSTIVSEKK